MDEAPVSVVHTSPATVTESWPPRSLMCTLGGSRGVTERSRREEQKRREEKRREEKEDDDEEEEEQQQQQEEETKTEL